MEVLKLKDIVEAELKILGELSPFNTAPESEWHDLIYGKDIDVDEIRRLNKLSNKGIYKNKQLKVNLFDYSFVIEYTNRGRTFIRKRLPTLDMDSTELNHLADKKRICWKHFLEVDHVLFKNQERRCPVYSVQDKPMIVIDVDSVPYWQVCKTIFEEKKWKFANNNHVSITPSTSGRGAHIHIWIDMRSVVKTSIWGADIRNSKIYYKNTLRYKVYRRLSQSLAESLESETGIVPDYNSLKNDGMAVTPREIGMINKQWEGKSPVKLDLEKDLLASIGYDPRKYNRYEAEANVFCEELEKLMFSSDGFQDWISYLHRVGIEVGRERYYNEVWGTMKKNIPLIRQHLASNMDNLWFSRKKEKFNIPQKGIAESFFGLKTRRNETYIRHFVMYILGLEISDLYKKNVKTNEYSRSGVERLYFDSDFLTENWYLTSAEGEEYVESLQIDDIASKLGGGETFETIRNVVPRLVYRYSADTARRVMCEAISMSGANDKWRRIDETMRFIYQVERSRVACLKLEMGPSG